MALAGHDGHASELTIQHRDVVVMIARREDLFARDIDQAGKLSERRAFVVIGMTKTQVNRVALVIELRAAWRAPAR